MKINYDERMQNLIEGLGGEKPGLLLHACCAPCASAVLERIVPAFDTRVFYYNPNTHPEAEYEKRGAELVRLLNVMNLPPLVPATYDPDAFFEAARGLEDEREGGARCRVCFEIRLRATARKARELGVPFFGTTLTVSPHKNAPLLNEIGETIAAEEGVRFLPSDFKKREGYKRSLELSAQYGLYRQDYCGCVFSLRAR